MLNQSSLGLLSASCLVFQGSSLSPKVKVVSSIVLFVLNWPQLGKTWLVSESSDVGHRGPWELGVVNTRIHDV